MVTTAGQSFWHSGNRQADGNDEDFGDLGGIFLTYASGLGEKLIDICVVDQAQQ